MAPDIRPHLARLARRLTNIDATDHATAEQRQGMRLLWLDGILASASTALYAEFVVLYMLALGASSTVIGLRASINGAAALAAPLIGAYLVSRSGARKRWVLWGPGGISRLALLAMAAVPWLARGEGAVWGLVALLSLQGFASAVGMPAHHSLLGDVVPLPIRGRFLGSSMMLNNIATVVVLPLAGFLVARIGGLGGYQTLLFLAALAGLGATSMYWRIPEPPAQEGAAARGGAPAGGLRDAWQSLRTNRPFLLFCAINFLWTLGINISGPFFTVHMVEGLGFTADTIAYLATVTTLFNVVALRYAGTLVDRHGAPKMTAIAMLLVPLMPLLWVFARTPLHIGVAKVYGFIAWAGFHVAALPMLLLLAPPRFRSQYMAAFNTVNGVAGVLAPLPAAWLYANWGFTSNLLISAGGRMAAGLLFVFLWRRGVLLPGQEPGAEPERELARA
jgi:MFS family permease